MSPSLTRLWQELILKMVFFCFFLLSHIFSGVTVNITAVIRAVLTSSYYFLLQQLGDLLCKKERNKENLNDIHLCQLNISRFSFSSCRFSVLVEKLLWLSTCVACTKVIHGKVKDWIVCEELFTLMMCWGCSGLSMCPLHPAALQAVFVKFQNKSADIIAPNHVHILLCRPIFLLNSSSANKHSNSRWEIHRISHGSVTMNGKER